MTMTENTEEEISLTAVEYLEQQNRLKQEALEVMPGKTDSCTYPAGLKARQLVYACKTCSVDGKAAGVCYACFVSCHTTHDCFELFYKRDFRCDCGTDKMSEKCCLKPVTTNSNPGNVYNHNFKGKYCFCDQEYDDNAEDGSMVQCYACEDWFHDKCIKNGLEEGSFETFICKTCVGSNAFLNSYRGLKEFQFVSELGDLHIDILDSTDEKFGPKRYNQDEELERTTKKLKTDDAVVESNTSIEQPSYKCMISSSLTNYEPCNLFLLENWKTKLCKCDSCCTLYSVNGLYYFLLSEEEDIVKCEEEISDGQDEESRVISQLASVDRVRTMNGVLAFNDLKSELMDFLRGFAETNQIVSERDIKSFFDKKEKDRRNI